jgi:hypothetical protein
LINDKLSYFSPQKSMPTRGNLSSPIWTVVVKSTMKNLDRCFGPSSDRTLIKTKRAEAEDICNPFLRILGLG